MKLFNWLQESPEGTETPESTEPPSPRLNARLVELRKISVKEVMIPRALVTALDADVQLRRVRRLKSAKVTYFPVYKGDLDHILGWIPKAKVLDLLAQEPNEDVRLAEHVRPTAEVPDTASVADLADAFVKSASPFLVVKSDQRTTVGIVSLTEFIELTFGFELESSSGSTTGPDVNLLRSYEL